MFRRAYDALTAISTQHCDLEYLRILHLAASTSEHDVEAALDLLLEAGNPFGFDEVRDLVNGARISRVPSVAPPRVDLSAYDRLLEARVFHG
jgi:hypothetical protein